MFGQVVTILCKKGDQWHPRVFRDAQIARDRGYMQRVYGETSNEVVAVHIKQSNGLAEGIYTVYGPKMWNALESVENAVSFKDGDIIWLGDWATVDGQLAAINDSDYPKGLYAFLRGAFDCVYSITNVSGPFTTLPHWEIAGR